MEITDGTKWCKRVLEQLRSIMPEPVGLRHNFTLTPESELMLALATKDGWILVLDLDMIIDEDSSVFADNLTSAILAKLGTKPADESSSS